MENQIQQTPHEEIKKIKWLLSDIQALFINPQADGNSPKETYRLIDRKLRDVRALTEFLAEYNYSSTVTH